MNRLKLEGATKVVFFVILVFSTATVAANTTYTLNGLFTAVFPHKPTHQKATQSHRIFHIYRVEDHRNSIIYVAADSYSTTKKLTNKSGKVIQWMVDAMAKSAYGTVTSFRKTTIDRHESAFFTISMSYQGLTGTWHGVATFKDGHVFQWGVQGIHGRSSESAKIIFEIISLYIASLGRARNYLRLTSHHSDAEKIILALHRIFRPANN